MTLALANVVLGLSAFAQDASVQAQIAQDERALAAARAAKSPKDEAAQLISIAMLYARERQKAKAIEYFKQAVPILHLLRDFAGEASALESIGQFYSDLGQNKESLAYLLQELPLRRGMSDPHGEATALDNIGQAYSGLGQRQKALEIFNQALAIRQRIGDCSGEAAILGDIGTVYSDLGQKQKALELFIQALPISQQAHDGSVEAGLVEATILDDIGQVSADMGQSDKALDFYNQALPIRHQVVDRAGEAETLDNIGSFSAKSGQSQNALELFDRALSIRRELHDAIGEAMSLDNIGGVYSDLGQNQKALEFFNQALTIQRELIYPAGEAETLDNIGMAYAGLQQSQPALTAFKQALAKQRQIGDRAGEAGTLYSIGGVYADQGQDQKAVVYYNESLPIERTVRSPAGEGYALTRRARSEGRLGDGGGEVRDALAARAPAEAVGDIELRGEIDTLMMSYFRDRRHFELAILFGMDAVNCYQQMRKNINGLEKNLQGSFAHSKSDAYRELAELLVQTGRLGEAEQVLDLLKEQELKEVIHGAAPLTAANITLLEIAAAHQQALEQLAIPEKKAADLVTLTIVCHDLQAKKTRTVEQETRMKSLEASIAQGNAALLAYFANTIDPELKSKLTTGADLEPSRLQESLAKLGPRVMGIRLLMGDRHIYVIVVTADNRKLLELQATPADLRNKVLQTMDDLRTKESDADLTLAHLQELYVMVVSPLEDQFKTLDTGTAVPGSVPTLLWSLDGALRYLPIAALFDGHRYMVERFNNVLFTPESYVHLTDLLQPSGAKPSVLAMGLSKPYGGLHELPKGMEELWAVVHDPRVPDSKGPMEGRLLADKQFTLAAFQAELGSGKSIPVVHISSHFVVATGGGEEPYLLLSGKDTGDSNGYAWRLSELENSAISFHGTRLLTLSACSTAKDYTSRDGLEMDSLGMIAQQKDAAAVLANALGCERCEYESIHGRLLYKMGPTAGRWQGGSSEAGAVGFASRQGQAEIRFHQPERPRQLRTPLLLGSLRPDRELPVGPPISKSGPKQSKVPRGSYSSGCARGCKR